jgi:hypothetical protein
MKEAKGGPSFLKKRSKKLFSGCRGLILPAPTYSNQKFFASFFQKRSASFL